MFRVTIVRPWASAVAAMKESIVGKSLSCSRSPCHQRCPAGSYLTIHRENAIGKPRLQVLGQPCFKPGPSLALGQQFNAFLNLRKRDYAYVLRLAVRGFEPPLDPRVGSSSSVVLGQDICIDQKTAHPRSTG